MWGGCGLFQELQATGETPECWGCSQKTNCSFFTMTIAKVRAERRRPPLENVTLWIKRGIETPGGRGEEGCRQASKKWLLRKKVGIWYT